MKRLLIIILSLITTLTLLPGCGSTDNAGNTLHDEISDTDSLLPFFEDGKLIWKASDFSDLYLDYWQERSESEALISEIRKGTDLSKFVNILSDMDKTLVYMEIDNDSFEKSSEKGDLPAELGDVIFHFGPSLPDYAFLQVFKSEDCGYLWFRLENRDSVSQRYHSSAFRISLSDFGMLENFLNGLDRTTSALAAKPVIYLYPEFEADINVTLRFEGTLSVTYPAYESGWNVRAYPDGRLINYSDNQEYSYLFWEGLPSNANWNFSDGCCVAGADTVSFLQQKLNDFGLTPREYNEFIVYWLPQMQNNPYNLIAFQWDEYERIAQLDITPEPSSVLRVFMVFEPLQQPVEITSPPERPAFTRQGFTVVEWGAARVQRPVIQ